MKIGFLKVIGNWRDVADAARTTINLEVGEGEPSSNWKRKMLLCEHSPIRKLHIAWKWTNIMYWVSVHFVRHKFGIEHWVRTQRTDRTGVQRGDLSQSTMVEHESEADAQAVINISRRRLCNQASPETRDAWKAFLLRLAEKEPELTSVCVPDCIYRGWCYEYRSCGFHKTEQYKEMLEKYREGINN